MKNVKLVPMILALVVPFCIIAQTLAPQVLSKNSYPFRQGLAKNGGHYGLFQRNAPRLYPGRMQKEPLAFPAHYQNVSLDEPARFPHQDSAASYFYSCPVALANGQILMVWLNELGDRIYCAASSDTGASWGSPVVVAAVSPGLSISFSITGVQTNTGRVIVFWEIDGTIFSSRSDDNGASWTTPASFVTMGSGLTISQTIDGKLWLVYALSDGQTSNLYFRTSTNNGSSWSAQGTIAATSAEEGQGAVVSGSGANLYAVYRANTGGSFGIYRRTSADGGSTWSAPAVVVDSPEHEFTPRVLRQSDEALWVTYELLLPSAVSGFSQWDIYYTKSTDGGASWSAPAEFTRYADFDGSHATTLINNQPFVAFASYRWGRVLFQSQLWYGLIGTTADNNPPPAVFGALAFGGPSNSAVGQAFVADESGVAEVKFSYTHNGVANGPFQMYDDGQHYDGTASDNIWGGEIGAFPLGEDIYPAFSVTDVSSNAVNLGQDFPIKIKSVHNAGNVFLSFGDNSQLGEFGAAPRTSAHWPAVNGQDYLYGGGLRIGANVAGQSRVMNFDYYEIDWNRTSGTPYTIAPGVSDQDGSVTYDDQSAFSAPIGLQVHQQSYQWSAPTRDDFIIFKYITRNLGVNGGLSDVFVSPWLDPDVTVEIPGENFDDRVGYDSQRSMMYIYDSQNDPVGYLGLAFLGPGNAPHTVYAHTISQDPVTDPERYEAMTNGSITLPTNPDDYRMLLTAPPFSLAAGDSAFTAYGIVMGADLPELQAHADTMAAIFKREVGFSSNPFLFASSSNLNFVSEVAANPDTAKLTVTNYGVQALTINALQTPASLFQVISSPTFPLTLQNFGDSFELAVIFAPTDRGETLDSLAFSSNDPINPNRKVYLRGKGIKISPANNGVIYAVTGRASNGALLTVDQNTGSGNLIGATGFTVLRAAAVRPSNGEIYGAVEGSNATILVRIDAQTGETLTSATVPIADIRAITFDVNDDLYGGTFGTGNLYRLNPATGEATLIANTGLRTLSGLAINLVDGKLWGATIPGDLNTIDKSTGAATLVGRTGLRTTGGLAFDAAGKLFGLAGFGANDVGELAQINTATAAGTTIGSTGFRNVYALAIRGAVAVRVDDRPTASLPDKFALHQNYPNPFNPSTTIHFALPRQSFVTLKIYNLSGEEVATLVEKNLAAGFHQVNWAAGELSSGVYFYRLQASDPSAGAGQGFAETRKFVLVK